MLICHRDILFLLQCCKTKDFAKWLEAEGCTDIFHMLIGIFYYFKYCSIKSGIYRQLVHLMKIVICLEPETLLFVSTMEVQNEEDLESDLDVNDSWIVNSLLNLALGR